MFFQPCLIKTGTSFESGIFTDSLRAQQIPTVITLKKVNRVSNMGLIPTQRYNCDNGCLLSLDQMKCCPQEAPKAFFKESNTRTFLGTKSNEWIVFLSVTVSASSLLKAKSYILLGAALLFSPSGLHSAYRKKGERGCSLTLNSASIQLPQEPPRKKFPDPDNPRSHRLQSYW